MDDIETGLARMILTRATFTADDVTANGSVNYDPAHRPNAAQNRVGSMFNAYARAGLIEFTGDVKRSDAPHRKGGMIRVWTATPRGKAWAETVLAPW